MKPAILYVFAGEKAQGAEIVIERLMNHNTQLVDSHLFIAPGKFAFDLIAVGKPYRITLVPDLKKLHRSNKSKVFYLLKAIRNYFSISYQVHKYLKANKISIIHANTIVPAAYLIPLIIYSKILLHSRIWFWSDHDIISHYSRLETYLSKLCARLYNNTLVVSNAVKQKYAGNNKVLVLYNGLDYNVFKPDKDARTLFRNKYNLTKETIVFGMPAVVHPRKGQLDLIAAFNDICIKHSDVRLFLAGGFEDSTPEYSESVKAAIKANSKITHIGYVDEMLGFLNGCDVIINNSNLTGSEPLGTAIYEAMACEKVVIASATGGTPEIIIDNIDGFLFEPENRKDLIDKMEYVITHILDFCDLRTAARNKVKTKFSIGGMVEKYDQIVFK